MKSITPIILSLVILVASCAEKRAAKNLQPPNPTSTVVEIPVITVDKSLLHYDNKKSLWTLNNQLYSGYAVTYYQDRILKEKIGFLNGRKQHQATRWHPDGHISQLTNYHKGILHGEKKLWSSDTKHVLVSQLNYHEGKAHGEQKLWYLTGELYKKLNLNMGREEGIQQAFRKNGDLYANYESRAGRIFGLKKAALCYGLADKNMKSEK